MKHELLCLFFLLIFISIANNQFAESAVGECDADTAVSKAHTSINELSPAHASFDEEPPENVSIDQSAPEHTSINEAHPGQASTGRVSPRPDTIIINEALQTADIHEFTTVREMLRALTAGYPSVYWRNRNLLPQVPGKSELLEPSDCQEYCSRTPVLRWQDNPWAYDYHIQLSRDEQFTDIILEHQDSATELEVDHSLAFQTTYYWRVRAGNGMGKGAWSDVRFFTTVPVLAWDPQELHFGNIPEEEPVALPAELHYFGSGSLSVEHIEIPDEQIRIHIPDSLQSDDPETTDFEVHQGEPVTLRVTIEGRESGWLKEHIEVNGGNDAFASLPVTAFIGRGVLTIAIDDSGDTASLLSTGGSGDMRSDGDSDDSRSDGASRNMRSDGDSEDSRAAAHFGIERTVAFPSVRAGERISRAVTISNTGNDTLEVHSAEVYEIRKSNGDDAGSGDWRSDILSTDREDDEYIHTFSSRLREFVLEPGEEIVDSVTFAPVFDPDRDHRPASEGYLIYHGAYDTRDTLYLYGNTKPVVAELEDQQVTGIGRNLTAEVTLSGEGSMDPNGGDISYIWHLIGEEEDHELSSQPEFTFDAPAGTHHFRLTVTDRNGASVAASARVDVISWDLAMDAAVEAGITAYGDSVNYHLLIADISHNPGEGSRILETNAALESDFSLAIPHVIRTTPSVSTDSLIFVISGTELGGYDDQGRQLWPNRDLGVPSLVTPAVDSRSGRIFTGASDGYFYAFDYNTGEPDWYFRAEGAISAPAVISRDRKLIFPVVDGTIYGYDLHTMDSGSGSVNGGNRSAGSGAGSGVNSMPAGVDDRRPREPFWVMQLQDSVMHAPAVDADNHLIVGTREGNLLQLAMHPDGDVNILWETSVCSRITTSPVIDGEGHIYVGCRGGDFYQVDGSDGTVQWTFSTGATIAATPAISDYRRIYIGNDAGKLVVLSTDGEKIWQFESGSAIRSDLLHIGGSTYTATMDGYVYGFYDGGGREAMPGIAGKQLSGTSAGTAGPDGFIRPVWGTYMGNHQRTGWAAGLDEATDTASDREEVPSEFNLSQNYPNPFNPDTQISYTIPEQAHVRLEVYNMLGQRVGVLVDEQQAAGTYSARFDGADVSSGMYIYRMTAGSYSQSRTMTLIK